MLVALLLVNAGLMLSGPLVVAAWWRARTGVPWGLFGVGAAVFVLSQVVHLPLNVAVARLAPPLPAGMGWLVPVGLGLSAGLCEELARYAGLRWWVPEARSPRPAVMVGLGHGGIESMILATFGIVGALGTAAAMNVADLPAETAAKIAELDGAPWLVLVGTLERAFAITCHVAFGMLALRAVVSGPQWLLASIGGHALLDAGAVALVPYGAMYAEVAIGLAALISVGVVWASWQEPHDPPAAAPIAPVPVRRQQLGIDAKTDNSRFDR